MPRVIGGIDYSLLKLPVTIYIINSLDQDVTVQIKGNIEKSTTNAVNVGSSFTVSAGSPDARTLTPDTSGWLPYLYLELTCSTAPSSGSITAYIVYMAGDKAVMVDSLEIRDTKTHNPDTDPDKIKIVEW